VCAKLPLQKSSFSLATAPENLLMFYWRLVDVGTSSSSSFPGNGARKLVDGTVLKVLANLIVFVDEVNGWPVGNPKRRFDEYSSKFSLSYETSYLGLLISLISSIMMARY
jgi:hypothetical protein